MPSTLHDSSADVISEERMSRPRMAKANLRKAEVEWRERVGRAIQRAVSLRGWSLKEFADAVQRDERQCARWYDGAERPQFDVIFSIASMQQPLVIAIAELAGTEVEIETVVRVKRKRVA